MPSRLGTLEGLTYLMTLFPLFFSCLLSLSSFLPSVCSDMVSWYNFPTLFSICSFLDHSFVLCSRMEHGACWPAFVSSWGLGRIWFMCFHSLISRDSWLTCVKTVFTSLDCRVNLFLMCHLSIFLFPASYTWIFLLLSPTADSLHPSSS